MLKKTAEIWFKNRFSSKRFTENLIHPNISAISHCSDECLCIGNMADVTSTIQNELKPNIVKVYHATDAEKVEIIMQLNDVTRKVFRPSNEKLLPSLLRIKTNILNANSKFQKKLIKKLRKEDKHEEIKALIQPTPNVALFNANGEKIDEEKQGVEAWEEGRILKVCDLVYHVICNPPQVESLKLIASPIVGMLIHPQIQFKTASLEYSRFLWYKKLPNLTEQDEHSMETESEIDTVNPCSKRQKLTEKNDSIVGSTKDWELVGNGRVYKATDSDIGSKLRLDVLPGNEKYPHSTSDELHKFYAEEVSTTTECVVRRGPEKCLFDERHAQTKNRCEERRFRFVCYNILADVYAKTEYAQDFLFPYCPDYAIDMGYRQQLIVKELAGYNADIMCLQEVDRYLFESLLIPSMSIEGFAGAFAAKDGMKEGVAMFYRRDKFRLQMVENIILRSAIKEERNGDLLSRIQENAEFTKNFLSKPTCLLVGLLQSNEDPTKHILIGNTHLYWHPRGCAVRIIQMEIILREMRHLHEKYSKNYDTDNQDITYVVAGDFNSHPHSAAVQLMTQGKVHPNHADWYSMGKAQLLPKITLTNSIKFKSACGFPQYTNFVTAFQGCLDYIFVDPKYLQVERVIPQPNHEDVTRYTALPNETSPSDHIAQVVELSWCENDITDHGNVP